MKIRRSSRGALIVGEIVVGSALVVGSLFSGTGGLSSGSLA
jgi:hypothetical protein